MASSAQCDQVFLGIMSALTTEFTVVHLEIGPVPATLAPPTVAA